MVTVWAYIDYVKSICNQNAIKAFKSAVSSLGGLPLFWNSRPEWEFRPVDSAGKEADLARLKWENGAPYREQTNVELFTAWLNRSFMNVQSQ